MPSATRPAASRNPAFELGPIGLGLAPLGNLFTRVEDADAEATLATAEARGIRWFDTAPFYGNGLAEERLGRYLRHAPARPILSTKVGRVLEPGVDNDRAADHFVDPLRFRPVFDYSRRGIQRSYSDSLQRLGVERVDVLLLHDVDRLQHARHRDLVRQLRDETLPALRELKHDGRVDAIGLGINDWDIGYEILASAPLDCVLLANRYTLLDHSAHTSGFLDTCARQGVAVLAGGVFNSGFLAGGDHYEYRPASAAMIARREGLQAVCRRHGVTLPAVALQFAAAHPAIASLTVGARSGREVDEIVAASTTHVPSELWTELRERELIPDDASVPAFRDADQGSHAPAR